MLMQIEPEYMHWSIKQRKAAVVYSDETSEEGRDVRWAHLAEELVLDTVQRHQMLYIVMIAANRACEVFDQFRGEISPDRRLPAVVNQVIKKLGEELRGRERMLSYVFERILRSLKPLRDRFRAQVAFGHVHTSEKPQMDHTDNADRLRWLIGDIQNAVINKCPTQGLSLYFDMLERELLAQGPAAHLDGRMMDQLSSDIITLDDMLQRVYFKQIGHSDIMEDHATPLERHQRFLKESTSRGRGVRLDRSFFTRTGRHMRLFFEAPWPKARGGRRDLEWFWQAEESRKRLAALWAAIRDGIKIAQIESGMDMRRSAIESICLSKTMSTLWNWRLNAALVSKSAKLSKPRPLQLWASN
jgi:hypothetical protein